MNFIHVPDDTYKLINALKNKYPSQRPLLDEIEGNTTQHLWHQLTENLKRFFEGKTQKTASSCCCGGNCKTC